MPNPILRPLLVLSLTSLAAMPAFAADKSWTIAGQSLQVRSPCAKNVTIEPADSLQSQVEIHANAKNVEEIEQLAVTGGAVATIALGAERCYKPGIHLDIGPGMIGYVGDSTLELAIKVPRGMAIDLQNSGSTGFRIGDVGGKLALKLSGSGEVEAANARDVQVEQRGSGGITLDRIEGILDAKLSGSGEFTVHSARLDHASLTHSGSGGMHFEEGELGALTIKASGSGAIAMPNSGALVFDHSGSGGSSFRHIAGNADLRLGGNGGVKIGEVTSDKVEIDQIGSAETRINGGHIQTLRVNTHGSGELVIKATVQDAEFDVTGSGSVRADHVLGNVQKNTRGSGQVVIGRN